MKGQRWQDWTIVLLGIWLVMSPFLGIGIVDDVAAINSYLSGTAIVLFGFVALSRPQMWEEYVALALAFWLIVSPFVLGFTHLGAPVWNQIIVGILIGGAALAVAMKNTSQGDDPDGHV